MTIPLEAHKERRLVLVEFERATTGPPHEDKPDIDIRGTRAPEFAYIVGVTQGRTIQVRLRRRQIDLNTKLFVTSSVPSFVEVKSPITGEIPPGSEADITLYGLKGGDPTESHLQIRFGSLHGPIIHQLVVRCFSPLRVSLTPHFSTIPSTEGSPSILTSRVDAHEAINVAQAIWYTCGIVFDVKDEKKHPLPWTTPGTVDDTGTEETPYGETANILAAEWQPETINIYFVPRFKSGLDGIGIRRSLIKETKVPNPGILVADSTRANKGHVKVRNAASLGKVLAHELGHFLGLSHVDDRNLYDEVKQRKDYWSQRMLMYVSPLSDLIISTTNDWKRDNGYGDFRSGAIIGHKDLPTIRMDSECDIVRTAIKAGPY